MTRRERQLTHTPTGKVLTNAGVWSPSGEWIVTDTRSDPAGNVFDGTQIQAVHAGTGEVRTLFESRNRAACGVSTWHPRREQVIFILGPTRPETDGWTYAPARRQGVIFDVPAGRVEPLEARDLTPAFTPGSLAGGTHVHQFSPDGRFVSFTYDDHLLTEYGTNARTVGVAQVGRPVRVPTTHPRNQNGTATCGLVVSPGPGGLVRACEEAWVGPRTLAFQGTVRTPARDVIEVFTAELPDDLTPPARPAADVPYPALPGVALRRMTFTDADPRPGLGGPRHWLRGSPDGSRIAFLRLNEAGAAKFWTVPTVGGTAVEVPHAGAVESAFTWHPDGERIACVVGECVTLIDVRTGQSEPLTAPGDPADGPRPEACVVSPDGHFVAFVRNLPWPGGGRANQVCVAAVT